jgi:hypothetical protein
MQPGTSPFVLSYQPPDRREVRVVMGPLAEISLRRAPLALVRRHDQRGTLQAGLLSTRFLHPIASRFMGYFCSL